MSPRGWNDESTELNIFVKRYQYEKKWSGRVEVFHRKCLKRALGLNVMDKGLNSDIKKDVEAGEVCWDEGTEVVRRSLETFR